MKFGIKQFSSVVKYTFIQLVNMEKNNIHERNNDNKIYVKSEVEVKEESFGVDDEEIEIGIKREFFNSDAKEKTKVNEDKAKRKASSNKRFKKRRRMRYGRNNDTKICVKSEVEVKKESFSVEDEEKEMGINEEFLNSDAKEKTKVNEEYFNVESEVIDPLEQVSSLDQSQVMNSKAKRKASSNKRFKKRRRMRYGRNNDTKICVKSEVEVKKESFSVGR
ncbi:hypothetical protein Anas_12906 [Armadillidium nasatum]|uniref:Uncharacterized protein n=1 Tax=Armadillidium nasatum TaxID=96803 RepID=A0A5N5T6M9_9CRUS|nr:hypothetical protein Anas_12906 [Armadillidium nasatum]